MSTGPNVASLFATPVVTLDVADAAAMNGDLRAAIEQREKTNPGTRHSGTPHSGIGDWQSDREMDRWGGAAAIKLLAIGRNTANRVTSDRHGNAVTINWRASMWASINRSGYGNEFRSHPGSFWSGVYYVDDSGIDVDPALGGELEFMDPRGPGPAMYAPQLAFGSAGLSVGANETIRPRSGRLVMFPAWLLHQVRPYTGKAERISIAFNLSL